MMKKVVILTIFVSFLILMSACSPKWSRMSSEQRQKEVAFGQFNVTHDRQYLYAFYGMGLGDSDRFSKMGSKRWQDITNMILIDLNSKKEQWVFSHHHFLIKEMHQISGDGIKLISAPLEKYYQRNGGLALKGETKGFLIIYSELNQQKEPVLTLGMIRPGMATKIFSKIDNIDITMVLKGGNILFVVYQRDGDHYLGEFQFNTGIFQEQKIFEIK